MALSRLGAVPRQISCLRYRREASKIVAPSPLVYSCYWFLFFCHTHTMPSSNLHTSCPQVICTLQMVCTLQVVRPPSSKVYRGTYDYLPGGVRRQPQWTLIGRSLDARWTLQWTLQWTLRKWYQGHDFPCLRIKKLFLFEKCLLIPHSTECHPW